MRNHAVFFCYQSILLIFLFSKEKKSEKKKSENKIITKNSREKPRRYNLFSVFFFNKVMANISVTGDT